MKTQILSWTDWEATEDGKSTGTDRPGCDGVRSMKSSSQVTDNSAAEVRTGVQGTHTLEAHYAETTNTGATQPILNTDPSVFRFKKHFF